MLTRQQKDLCKETKNMNNTYHIRTFGCQMNDHDSETMAGLLEQMGYHEAENKESADILIINTCSVRENAHNSFFGTLGQYKKLKEENQDIIIAVAGCMMQQDQLVKEVKSKYPFVDFIFGTYNIHELPDLIQESRLIKKTKVRVLAERGALLEGLPVKRKHPFRALVDIMYGCNNFCSYCIVPYTRGREVSRAPSDIISEVKAIVEKGTKEVMLLGQNVNSYEYGFPELLGSLSKIEGLKRVRFMTSHPKDMTEDLIKGFSKYNNLSKYVHLPVQSGSDNVLKMMNRGYTSKRYLQLIKDLRREVPHIGITTDIIVGFPGESEEDFQETLNLVKEVQFDSAFTFIYSKREGTPSSLYENQIEEDVKHERFQRLVKVVNESSLSKNLEYIGKTVDVLVEGLSRKNKEFLEGRTDTFKLVNFKGSCELLGEIIPIKITDGNTFSLKGTVDL